LGPGLLDGLRKGFVAKQIDDGYVPLRDIY
jgi:hypothetical protein